MCKLLILFTIFCNSCFAKHYIVTGGAGFIGSHLVDELIRQNHTVTVIDDLSTGLIANVNKEAKFIKQDIANTEPCYLTPDIDGVFHLAAIASVEKSTKYWAKTHNVNSTATVKIFDKAAKYKTPVVYASSAAIYGEDSVNAQESDEPKPKSAYGLDKLYNEKQAKIAYDFYGLPSIGLRFFNVYGPRQSASPYSGVIAIFSNKFNKNKPIRINGDGMQIRDYIYVTDVVSALNTSMQHLHKKPKTQSVYNVATGNSTSLLDLVASLETITGKKVPINHGPDRSGDIKVMIGNPNKIKEDLGFESKISFIEGLQLNLNS